MKCISCGAELAEDVKVCGSCGFQIAPIEITMPKNDINAIDYQRNVGPLVVGVIALGAIIALVFMFSSTNTQVNNSALNVVKSMFEAIDTRNPTVFTQCLTPQDLAEFKQEAGTNYMKEVETSLAFIDAVIDDQYQDGWSRKATYKALDETQVEATILNETNVVKVTEIDGKFYVSNMSGF